MSHKCDLCDVVTILKRARTLDGFDEVQPPLDTAAPSKFDIVVYCDA